MKAIIPHKNKWNKTTKKAVYDFVKDDFNKAKQVFVRRLFKLFGYVLHNEFGFGTNRLNKAFMEVTELLNEMSTDELFWEHLDHIIIDQLKLEFDREDIDIDGSLK